MLPEKASRTLKMGRLPVVQISWRTFGPPPPSLPLLLWQRLFLPPRPFEDNKFREHGKKENMQFHTPSHSIPPGIAYPQPFSFLISLGIGNGGGKQGRGNQPPYRRYEPDTEIQHRPRKPHRPAKPRAEISPKGKPIRNFSINPTLSIRAQLPQGPINRGLQTVVGDTRRIHRFK